jgi:hypothetical protein
MWFEFQATRGKKKWEKAIVIFSKGLRYLVWLPSCFRLEQNFFILFFIFNYVNCMSFKKSLDTHLIPNFKPLILLLLLLVLFYLKNQIK